MVVYALEHMTCMREGLVQASLDFECFSKPEAASDVVGLLLQCRLVDHDGLVTLPQSDKRFCAQCMDISEIFRRV